jgi:exosortase/archaeosortase family protein
MKLKEILYGRKIIVFVASLLILLVAYIAFKFIFPNTDTLIRIISSITNPFLLLVEKFANLILQWTGSALAIQNHSISLNGIPVEGFTTQVMYKKVTLFYIILLWLTQPSTWKKIGFTGIYLVLGFLSATFYNVAGAYSITSDTHEHVLLSTPHSMVFFCMTTILLLWYLMNKKSWFLSPSKLSGIVNWLERKMPDIIVILYVYSLVLFSLDFFSFRLWISFLFGTSQKILGLLGYDAVVESNLLIGDNGSIAMARPCLGILTMFVFAAIVYLTGYKDRKTLWYIVFGVLMLNLANIVRFVLLFIHIQKHGDYMLAMDVHDIYNYAIYTMVFILWVIWFERFKNIKTIVKRKVNK